ncbi:hypothetical protein [Rhizobium gallicum]|uniref:hypothetical protein n=1 Tax=Rhizobium gallicum TaxID=56730 RepID=UPI001EF8B5AE|nr:hypothetical protein [Rhizobium gallicum]ULJ73010.1 hypothetical protein L2W42_05030 [Rhizobium gallicum]
MGGGSKQTSGRRAGGAATAGGINFQAVATAIACVHMARGTPLLWLEKIVDDTPVAVDGETGGSGDDIRLVLRDGRTVEVQVKKGLRATEELWDALSKLASAIDNSEVDFGVLVVSSSSSNPVKDSLANDIIRIGDGRMDHLSEIGERFVERLLDRRIDVQRVCGRLRVQTIHATASDQASVVAARAELSHICSNGAMTGLAWSALLKDCATMIEQRGRRDLPALLQMLVAERIQLAGPSTLSPIQLLAKLVDWTFETNATFTILGVERQLNIDEAWIPLTATVRDPDEQEG